MNQGIDNKLIVKLLRSERQLAEIDQEISKAIAHLEEKHKKLESQSAEIRSTLKEQMRMAVEQGLSDGKYEDAHLKINYRRPYIRQSVDVVALKVKMPKIYEKFKKITEVSDSITVKLK